MADPAQLVAESQIIDQLLRDEVPSSLAFYKLDSLMPTAFPTTVELYHHMVKRTGAAGAMSGPYDEDMIRRLFTYLRSVHPSLLDQIVHFVIPRHLAILMEGGAARGSGTIVPDTPLEQALNTIARSSKEIPPFIYQGAFELARAGFRAEVRAVLNVIRRVLVENAVGRLPGDLSRILSGMLGTDIYLDALDLSTGATQLIGLSARKAKTLRRRFRKMSYFWWLRRRGALQYSGPKCGPYYDALWIYPPERAFGTLYPVVRSSLDDVLGRDMRTYVAGFL